MAFVGGPCTEGAGTIVSRDLSDPIRSHKDIDKDAVPQYRKAIKFYEGLAKQLVNQGHVLDLFASALDQVSCYWLPLPILQNNFSLLLDITRHDSTAAFDSEPVCHPYCMILRMIMAILKILLSIS
jgi:hypothetical protein